MNTPNPQYQVQMVRTLWQNTYRGKVTDETGEYVAIIRVILGIPLERSEVPENAPQVAPYLSVHIEEASLNSAEDVIPFETALSDLLLSRLRNDDFLPEYCHFFYPSPTDMLNQQIPTV